MVRQGRAVGYEERRLSDIENKIFYDYRIEGGKYLTQNNPNRLGPRRECIIIYVGLDD